MRTYLLTFSFLTVLGCQPAPEMPMHYIYGLRAPEQDSLGVELDLAQFQNLRALAEQAEAIYCRDSLPNIVLRKPGATKSVYLYNYCMEELGCTDRIMRKNRFIIRNGLAFKPSGTPRSLDNLERLLSRDFGNYGEHLYLSDRPSKLVVYIIHDSAGLEWLPSLLDRITIAYDKAVRVDDTTANLNVWLMPPMPPPPPPPPR